MSHDPMRRADILRMTPTELAIRDAVLAVEALPADERLSDAVIYLEQARMCVADYVDGQPRATWGDQRDKWSDAISKAHPSHTDDRFAHVRYGLAMEMVGNRRSKHALVALVCWLLTERDAAKRGQG